MGTARGGSGAPAPGRSARVGRKRDGMPWGRLLTQVVKGALYRVGGLSEFPLGRHRARYLTVRLPMPPVRPVRETFTSYGSREKDIMGKVHFANSTERSPWSACAFAGYLCTVSRPSPSGPSPCT